MYIPLFFVHIQCNHLPLVDVFIRCRKLFLDLKKKKTDYDELMGKLQKEVYFVHVHVHVGSKHGSRQSMDCTAQSMDLCFEQRSMDCPLNPWTAQTEGMDLGNPWIDLDKLWIRYSCGYHRVEGTWLLRKERSRTYA